MLSDCITFLKSSSYPRLLCDTILRIGRTLFTENYFSFIFHKNAELEYFHFINTTIIKYLTLKQKAKT